MSEPMLEKAAAGTVRPPPAWMDRLSNGDCDSLPARNSLIEVGETVVVRIRRSDAEDGDRARFDEFDVPYSRSMRVLDALNHVSEHQAPDLAYRWFCGSKMCGTCAVRMNGREVLACWEAVEATMTIEPLRNLPIIRDLVVDRAPYERKVASFEPWLERSDPYPGLPEPLSHRSMGGAANALDCISCMSCYSACPVVGLGDLTNFAGPAPLVQLAQTALDPRNEPDKVERTLAQTGIFNCVSCYKCEEVCPAKIPIVTRIIEPLKAKAARSRPSEASHALTFRNIVARRGRIDPTELVLRLQGIRALLGLGRALVLLRRGKIRPWRTIHRAKSEAAAAALRLLGSKRRPERQS